MCAVFNGLRPFPGFVELVFLQPFRGNHIDHHIYPHHQDQCHCGPEKSVHPFLEFRRINEVLMCQYNEPDKCRHGPVGFHPSLETRQEENAIYADGCPA